MTRRTAILSTAISILALLTSISSLVIRLRQDPAATAKDVQYVLCLGTNDQYTNEPVFPPEEALEHANACDDLVKEFNQSSILIQANETTTEFYSGG